MTGAPSVRIDRHLTGDQISIDDMARFGGRAEDAGPLVSTAVASDRAQAFRWAKHQLGFYSGVAPYFEPAMEKHGFGAEYVQVRDAFHAGQVMEAIDLVSDAMVDELALAGTADDVRAKLGRYEEIVDFVMIYTPTFLVAPDEIRAAHDAMIDAFAV